MCSRLQAALERIRRRKLGSQETILNLKQQLDSIQSQLRDIDISRHELCQLIQIMCEELGLGRKYRIIGGEINLPAYRLLFDQWFGDRRNLRLALFKERGTYVFWIVSKTAKN